MMMSSSYSLLMLLHMCGSKLHSAQQNDLGCILQTLETCVWPF